MKSFTYKGYTGTCEPSVEDECLHGRILHINDVITYEGSTVGETKQAFQEAVDEYLSFCKAMGKPADKPYSGNLNIRPGADLHRKLAEEAFLADVSINERLCQILNQHFSGEARKVENHFHITAEKPVFSAQTISASMTELRTLESLQLARTHGTRTNQSRSKHH